MVSDDGKTVFCWGKLNEVDIFKWQSEQDLKSLTEDREPVEAPLCPYKIQPENQGKLVWLSGKDSKALWVRLERVKGVVTC